MDIDSKIERGKEVQELRKLYTDLKTIRERERARERELDRKNDGEREEHR